MVADFIFSATWSPPIDRQPRSVVPAAGLRSKRLAYSTLPPCIYNQDSLNYAVVSAYLLHLQFLVKDRSSLTRDCKHGVSSQGFWKAEKADEKAAEIDVDLIPLASCRTKHHGQDDRSPVLDLQHDNLLGRSLGNGPKRVEHVLDGFLAEAPASKELMTPTQVLLKVPQSGPDCYR